MPRSVLVRRVAVLGGAVLVAMGASVGVSADTFRLLQPTTSESLYYADANISISFTMKTNAILGPQAIGFALTNKSKQAIEVDWNRSSMTLPDGQTSNVMHEGIKFISAGSSIPPTTIPPGGTLSNSAIPTLNVAYLDGWYIRSMGIETGSQFGLYLALNGAGVSPYNFVFQAVEITRTAADSGSFMLIVLGMLAALALGSLLLIAMIP